MRESIEKFIIRIKKRVFSSFHCKFIQLLLLFFVLFILDFCLIYRLQVLFVDFRLFLNGRTANTLYSLWLSLLISHRYTCHLHGLVLLFLLEYFLLPFPLFPQYQSEKLGITLLLFLADISLDLFSLWERDWNKTFIQQFKLFQRFCTSWSMGRSECFLIW